MIELLTFLSDILQRNGLKGLLNHPKKLYQRMLMADIEPKIAGAVVVTVLANIPKMIIDDRSLNRDQIVELIRITCPLNDEISEQLADLYLLLLDKKNMDMLMAHKVFTETELHSRCEIMLENYCKTVNIEGHTMVDMVRKNYLPAIEEYLYRLSRTISSIY